MTDFGLLDPSHRADPHRAFAALRERAPVHYSEAWGCWLITRYDDCVACFRDELPVLIDDEDRLGA